MLHLHSKEYVASTAIFGGGVSSEAPKKHHLKWYWQEWSLSRSDIYLLSELYLYSALKKYEEKSPILGLG